MNRPKHHAPNSKPNLLNRWREDDLKTAIAAIAYHHGTISNARLAEVLGVSSHGLRRHLIKRRKNHDGEWVEVPGIIRVELRGGKGEPFQPWYSLDPNYMPPAEEVPPLKPGFITYDERHAPPADDVKMIEFKGDEE